MERLEGVLERTALKLLVEPSGAEVRLDGRSLGVVPAEPVKVSPGKHQVSVSAPGYETVSFELEAAGGAVIPLVVHLAPSDRPRAGAGPPGGGATQAPAWPALALGAVAVGAAAGATWGLLAASDLEAEGDAITGRTDHSSPEWEHERPKAQEKYDQAAARRNLALGLGVAALAAGGVAAWLFVSAGEGDEVDPWESTAALGVAPAPDGGLVTAAWRF